MNDCIEDDMWNGLCSEKGGRASDDEKWSESVGLMVPVQQAHIAHTVCLYTMDKYKNTTYTRECAVHMYVCMYTCVNVNGHTQMHQEHLLLLSGVHTQTLLNSTNQQHRSNHGDQG